MNVLNDLSKVYSDFAPGSVQEISMQDGGKNIRVTLLDSKLDILKIKEELSKKYFIDFKDKHGSEEEWNDNNVRIPLEALDPILHRAKHGH